jgi:hypothetical protein
MPHIFTDYKMHISILLGLILAWAMMADTIQAEWAGPPPIESQVTQADLIVTGKIIDVKTEETQAIGTIEIESVLKGDKNIKTVLLRWGTGKQREDIDMEYHKGQEGVWLLNKSAGDYYTGSTPWNLQSYNAEKIIKMILGAARPEEFLELLKDKNYYGYAIGYLSNKKIPSEKVMPAIMPLLLDPAARVTFLADLRVSDWLGNLVDRPAYAVRIIDASLKALEELDPKVISDYWGYGYSYTRIYTNTIIWLEKWFGTKQSYFGELNYEKDASTLLADKHQGMNYLNKIKDYWYRITELIVAEKNSDDTSIKAFIKQLNDPGNEKRESAFKELAEILLTDMESCRTFIDIAEGYLDDKKPELAETRAHIGKILEILRLADLKAISKLENDKDVLVALLRNERETIRQKAHNKLVRLTGNRTIKFRANAPEAEREKTIAEWEKVLLPK